MAKQIFITTLEGLLSPRESSLAMRVPVEGSQCMDASTGNMYVAPGYSSGQRTCLLWISFSDTKPSCNK